VELICSLNPCTACNDKLQHNVKHFLTCCARASCKSLSLPCRNCHSLLLIIPLSCTLHSYFEISKLSFDDLSMIMIYLSKHMASTVVLVQSCPCVTPQQCHTYSIAQHLFCFAFLKLLSPAYTPAKPCLGQAWSSSRLISTVNHGSLGSFSIRYNAFRDIWSGFDSETPFFTCTVDRTWLHIWTRSSYYKLAVLSICAGILSHTGTHIFHDKIFRT
jgi:hypothetical protein